MEDPRIKAIKEAREVPEGLNHPDKTLRLVHTILITEVSPMTANDLINQMQDAGILFRERA